MGAEFLLPVFFKKTARKDPLAPHTHRAEFCLYSGQAFTLPVVVAETPLINTKSYIKIHFKYY